MTFEPRRQLCIGCLELLPVALFGANKFYCLSCQPKPTKENAHSAATEQALATALMKEMP